MVKAATDTPRAAERILATATELFTREGTRAVGVDEIVARAGATKPSLYRAFASKDQLIAAYLEAEGHRARDAFDAAIAALPDDPKAQILAYFDDLTRRAEAAGYRGSALTNAALEYPDPRHPGRQVAVAHKEALREQLRAMTRAMGAKKPKKLADSLLLLIEGAQVSAQVLGPDGPAGAARGAAEALIAAHMKGHGKDTAGHDRL